VLRILRDYTPKIIKKDYSGKNLGSYLAGLIEGDGHIFVPEHPHKRDSKGRLIYPSIQIALHSKDLPLFILLQQVLKCGSLSKKKGKAYIYTIANKEGLIFTINLINGYFRTSKIEALHRLINHINIVYNKNLPILSRDLSAINHNS